MKKNILRLFALCLVLFISAQVLAQTEPPLDLDAYVARNLKEFEVPGLAVAVVKDSKVAPAKSYGARNLGEPTPVDEQTLFGIASTTKAFTAAALAFGSVSVATCEGLAELKLPNTTITAAQSVAPGAFAPPSGSAAPFKELPAFCRLA